MFHILNVTNRFGIESTEHYEGYAHSATKFIPVFVGKGAKASPPETFKLNEIILQAVMRKYLKDQRNQASFLNDLGINMDPAQLEVLGEKALQEGIVDILIKETTSVPSSKKVAIEVKSNRATMKDFDQIGAYVNTLGKECLRGVLIARDFQKKVIAKAKNSNISLVRFSLPFSNDEKVCFDDLSEKFTLTILKLV